VAHLVLGMGGSGYWAARLVLEILARPLVVVDDGDGGELRKRAARLGDIAKGLGLPFRVYLGGMDILPSDISRIVVSPGVPGDHYLIRQALSKGIEVIGEMELAWRCLFLDGSGPQVVAITGTNGKTTVTSMVGHMMNNLGIGAWVGGNIGTPLSRLVVEGSMPKWVILEVSSFQLEWVDTFSPMVGAILNLGDDHLDRHGDMETYMTLKSRILPQRGKGLLKADDPWLQPLIREDTYLFSTKGGVDRGLGVERGVVCWREGTKREEVMEVERLDHPLRLNLDNVLAALALGKMIGLSFPSMLSALKGFRFLPHRLELVGEKVGIKFYNDSKATNPPAVARALTLLEDPVILLMGGRNKGLSFTSLAPIISERVKGLVVFGEASDDILRDLSKLNLPMEKAQTMGEAFKKALVWAKNGDAILLSPGCASFDEFSSYGERGEVFRRLVASGLPPKIDHCRS